MRIILGSQSPRRKEILSFFTLPFEQISPHFAEELIPFEGDPQKYASTLSEGKALSLSERFSQAVIIAADTVVFREGKIYNKPETTQEAFAMLSELVGQWHSVFTSVTVSLGKMRFTKVEQTRVLFHPLSSEQIKRYHDAFNCTDKAGGYGIQMAGSLIVNRMEGCFYNVMGLPISSLRELLLNVHIDLWDYLRS